MDSKIVAYNTSVVINNYELGDCTKLEMFFVKYDPVTHSLIPIAIHYDMANKKLYLPRGIDIWWIENLLNEKAEIKKDAFNKFDRYKDIKINALPRDEDQVKALRFVLGKGEYSATLTKSQLHLNLNTGKGKTYIAIGLIHYTGIKSIIITYGKSILDQWRAAIMQYTNIEDREICNIDGSGSILRLLNKSDNEIAKYKVYLVTHNTLKSYGDNNGWDKLNPLFANLKIGIKIFDEAHTNFDNMCMIDYYTHVYKTYYLTATPARSNDDENRVYQTAFKNVLAIDLFHYDSDPHTHYVAMRFNSRPDPVIISKCKNKYGLDRSKYTNYIVNNENFRKMCVLVLDKIFSKICTQYTDKLLIYIGTNQAIETFYSWIIQIFPGIKNDIGIFTSVVNDEDKQIALTKRIIITTTKSAGAAIDIIGLKCTLLLAEPFKSEVLARQTLGRTRARNTYYIEVVDKGFFYCNKYFLSKRPIFNTYAASTGLIEVSQIDLDESYNKLVKVSSIMTSRSTLVKPFTIDLALANKS